jgi:PPM family protein phosphatase
MWKNGVQLTKTLVAAGLTDVGQRRQKNEDSYLLRPEQGILIVADGIGGLPAGEVASQLGCETAFASLMKQPSSEELTERMARAVTSANQAIWNQSQAHPASAGMGTTVTSLLVDSESGRLGIGHVGDSRAYRFRDGELERLTTDHTLVQDLLDAGALRPSEAHRHPLGNVLNRAVGTEPRVTPQVITEPVLPGDLFLLCTDGLLAVLSEEDIADTVREELGPTGALESQALQAIAERLVRQANEGGAPDNVTVGMLGIPV